MTEMWIPPRIWEDGECWIIGGGPSMPRQFGVPEETIQAVMCGDKPPSVYTPYLKPIMHDSVIGINNAYLLGEWINFLFFGDYNWYLPHQLDLAEWASVKVSCAVKFGEIRYEGVKFMPKGKRHAGISDTPGVVCWNSNSGVASLSLAYQLGVRRILLLGFDMRLDDNQVSHWHGSHVLDPVTAKPKVGANPMRRMSAFLRHTVTIPDVAADAKRLGLEILNVSPTSVINEFPKVNLNQIL